MKQQPMYWQISQDNDWRELYVGDSMKAQLAIHGTHAVVITHPRPGINKLARFSNCSQATAYAENLAAL